jgi:hypothetical protein
MRHAFHERVRDALRDVTAPAEGQAEERGWAVVREAFAEREPQPRVAGLRRRGAIGLAIAAAVTAFALSPAGAEVRDWIEDAITTGEEDARPLLGSLPASGSVLVESRDGVWVVSSDGSRRHLGDYRHATWSPHGLYVGASDGRRLFALTPQGVQRWSIAAPAPIDALDWSSDEGYRIAYVAGRELRVVAGDGTGDARLVPEVGAAVVAWRPESLSSAARHELAYVDARNRVVIRDTDTGRVVGRSEEVPDKVGSLQWSADGEYLLVEASGFASLVDATGAGLFKGPVATGSSATLAPSGERIAVVRPDRSGLAELALVRPGFEPGRGRVLYPTAPGTGGVGFGPPVFSPDGEWILLPWPQADQWIFVRVADRRVVPVGDISRQLDPDGRGATDFPRVAGWCC